ncbi:MAG: thiamine phosphate synthase [Methanimicrococcus sp.]|nr:thiamine phosphate synthase [Methanimicrococcus sp.]MCL2141378.1 thiamine phosphate synthase [Methanimicrococcus sp.]
MKSENHKSDQIDNDKGQIDKDQIDKDQIDYSVYLVTDRSFCPPDMFLHQIEQSILGGVSIVQLREKDADSLSFYESARHIFSLLKKIEVKTGRKVPFLINDRLDIALAVDCDGLHVGQSDLPAVVARRLLGPDKILGVSVSTIEEAKIAEADGADYLGAGAVFPTGTKKDAADVPPDKLKEIKNAVSIPVVAIGGISIKTMPLLKGTGIDGVAVVSAIMGSDDAKKAAEELKKIADELKKNSG